MAEFIESSQLIKIYKDNFNFKVYAGPGAGKTYFLVQNIKDVIENSKKLKDNQIRKILCITYTNAAVDEIKNRLGHYNDYVVVRTIHSFLYEYVIKPYQQQLKIIINQTFHTNISSKTKMYPRLEGFGLLSKLKVSDFIGVLKEKYQILMANELTKKKISECVLDITSINKYPFNEKGLPFIKEVTGLGHDDLLKLKTALWEEEGVLDFDEILYFSYILLNKYDFISYDIHYLFPYILMDEYQDTNPIQNKILELLCNKKITIGVVGDIAQSIYGFINSTYREFEHFKPTVKDFKTFVIDGNRRSNQNIVHFLNYIRSADKKLNEQKCLVNQNDSKVKLLLCEREDVDVLARLNIENIRVLCRRWTDAFEYITNIKDEQRKALKQVHNYYRYSIDIDLTREFNSANIDWINNVKIIISIYNAIKLGNFGGILNQIKQIFDVNILNNNQRVNGKELLEIINFINLFKTFDDNMKYFDIIHAINNFIEGTFLKSYEKLELIDKDNDLYREKFHPYLNKLELKTLKIMYEEVFTEDSKYLTIHKTKGKEYDSVLVNLVPMGEEKIWGDVLNALETPIIFHEKINDEITEFIRIAYVAFSRARNDLYIHLKNTKEDIQPLLEKLEKYCKEKNIQEPFYEIIDIND
ncbi:MAG: ATP-dependent helicase [Clostridia bacterium]|nr:ATP-dependent helicase [Clostridia bacterium]